MLYFKIISEEEEAAAANILKISINHNLIGGGGGEHQVTREEEAGKHIKLYAKYRDLLHSIASSFQQHSTEIN